MVKKQIEVGDYVRSIYNRRGVYEVTEQIGEHLVKVKTIGADIVVGAEYEYTVRREILEKITLNA